MVRIVSMPPLVFKCVHCGATCEGEEKDFTFLHTRPPMWNVQCAYCFLVNRVDPKPLVSKYVGAHC